MFFIADTADTFRFFLSALSPQTDFKFDHCMSVLLSTNCWRDSFKK